MADCGTPGGPRASTGSLVGRAGSWSLITESRGPRTGVGSLVTGGRLLTQLGIGLGISETCIGLLIGRTRPQLVRGWA